MLPDNLSHYTDERNVQILLSLLKQWGLSQVIVSPGSTHGTFVRPVARKITTYTYEDSFPEIEAVRIGIFFGAHNRWSERLTKTVDSFCKKYNAVVLHDHTSNYKGGYGVLYPLVAGQRKYRSKVADLDLLIHIGNVSGDYYSQMTINPAIVWRVNPDGNLVDLFKRLKAVFALTEDCFFEAYNRPDMKAPPSREKLFDLAKDEEEAVEKSIPELSFSNIFCCSKLAPRIPSDSVLHLAILSSLRSMNMFKLDKSITVYSNVGGFGIDGATSTLIGSSLASPQKLHFLVTGDLAFFYDINACGNRHVSKNLRILLVNNGLGVEFKVGFNFLRLFEEDTNPFMAAEGHFGAKSKSLVRHYAEDLGFEYLTANDKKSFTENLDRFVSPMTENSKPMIFEVFTEEKNEHDALEMLLNAYEEH